jgi:hypothetical protein
MEPVILTAAFGMGFSFYRMGLPNTSGLMAAGILVLLLPLKVLLYLLVFSKFRLKARTGLLTTFNLANFSEFGLIVGAMAAANGQIDSQWLVVITMMLSASFILAAPLNRHADRIFELIGSALKLMETKRWHPEEIPFAREPWEIFVLGMGRVGTGAYDWFKNRYGNVVLGLDFNFETVSRHQSEGPNVKRHDITDPDFWQRLPASAPDWTVKLIVMAIPGLEPRLYLMRMLKKRGFRGKVASAAFYDDDVEKLRETGVDTAFNIYGEAGAGLAAHAIENLDVLEK